MENSAIELTDNPMERFADVYRRAALNAPFDHTACVLATSSRNLQPSSRVVLLKGHSRHGFVFFTNYLSRKGKELGENPRAALCFYWPWLDEQVRAEGKVELLSATDSDAYFASRPRISQLGAWASQQSFPLESRDKLMIKVRELEQQYEGQEIPRPDYWGGFLMIPESVEFWRSADFRLHDRFLYTRNADKSWSMTRLNP